MSVATIGSILNSQQLLSADVSTARIAVWLTLCHSWFCSMAAMSNPRAEGFVRRSLGVRCSKSILQLITCSCFDKS